MKKPVIAHRGFSNLYPESTMLAYEKAFDENIYGLECDVHLTSDNQLVVIHDYTIDRTVQGGYKGDVSSYTLSQLKAFYFSYPTKYGDTYKNNDKTKIITLNELFERFEKNTNYIIQLQRNDDFYLNTVINVIEEYDMSDNVWVFGSMGRINRVKALKPNLFTINDGRPNYNNYMSVLNNAITIGHEGVSISNNASDYQFIEMVTNIHNAGKIVWVSYLANDFENQYQRLINFGVDYVLGDDPQLMGSEKAVYGSVSDVVVNSGVAKVVSNGIIDSFSVKDS